VAAAIGESVGVVTRPGDEYLNWTERWARGRLEPVLGPLRVIDVNRKGGPPGLHDFEADLPDGAVAAIEITSEVEEARLSLMASVGRHFRKLRLPGSNYAWQVGLTADVRVNAIRPAALLKLLSDMEQQGRTRALNLGDYRDPFVARLGTLGIESVYGFKAKPGRDGIVRVAAGSYSGREWGKTAIDTWLDNFLTSSTGQNKLAKLVRAAHVTERHLVIVVEPLSAAGMGISLGLSDREEEGATTDAIPSLIPPEPLTHLWLMPLLGTGEALRWTRHSGWVVTNLGPLPSGSGDGTDAALDPVDAIDRTDGLVLVADRPGWPNPSV
jgi:hypothetical protein